MSTSKAQNETSPWKSLKFNQNNIKILQAKVRLQKLNFGNLSNASIDKTENHDVMPVPTASCSKSQVSSSKLRKILLVLPEGKRNGYTYSKVKRFLEGLKFKCIHQGQEGRAGPVMQSKCMIIFLK